MHAYTAQTSLKLLTKRKIRGEKEGRKLAGIHYKNVVRCLKRGTVFLRHTGKKREILDQVREISKEFLEHVYDVALGMDGEVRG